MPYYKILGHRAFSWLMYWLADRFICLWSAPAILCQSSRQTNPRTKYSTHSLSIHYAFRQSTRLNLGNQNLPIQLKIKHNGWSGTVVSPTSLFANVSGQFPNCFRLISSWKNEVAYTCVSLISLLKAKGLVGETTGLCWSTSYMSLDCKTVGFFSQNQ